MSVIWIFFGFMVTAWLCIALALISIIMLLVVGSGWWWVVLAGCVLIFPIAVLFGILAIPGSAAEFDRRKRNG